MSNTTRCPGNKRSMMATETPADILADACRMQEAALERLDAGDIRDDAEKFWCATKRAQTPWRWPEAANWRNQVPLSTIWPNLR